jgi:hypothetical protein
MYGSIASMLFVALVGGACSSEEMELHASPQTRNAVLAAVEDGDPGKLVELQIAGDLAAQVDRDVLAGFWESAVSNLGLRALGDWRADQTRLRGFVLVPGVRSAFEQGACFEAVPVLSNFGSYIIGLEARGGAARSVEQPRFAVVAADVDNVQAALELEIVAMRFLAESAPQMAEQIMSEDQSPLAPIEVMTEPSGRCSIRISAGD